MEMEIDKDSAEHSLQGPKSVNERLFGEGMLLAAEYLFHFLHFQPFGEKTHGILKPRQKQDSMLAKGLRKWIAGAQVLFLLEIIIMSLALAKGLGLEAQDIIIIKKKNRGASHYLPAND